MKDKQTTNEKYYHLIKHFQKTIIIENLTNVIRSYNLPTACSRIFQELGYLQKDIGFYYWNYQGEVSTELVNTIISKVQNISKVRQDGKEYYPEKYIELQDFARSKGYTGNSPVASMAFSIGKGEYRIGLKKMKQLLKDAKV